MSHKKKRPKVYRFAFIYKMKDSTHNQTEFIKNGRKLKKRLRSFNFAKCDSAELWDAEELDMPNYFTSKG